jgi:hypothetical protein
VKGVIRDIQATPVVGVQVQAENGGESVHTDSQGSYSIKVRADDRLFFSKKRFISQSVSVDGQMDVSIQMTKGE